MHRRPRRKLTELVTQYISYSGSSRSALTDALFCGACASFWIAAVLDTIVRSSQHSDTMPRKRCIFLVSAIGPRSDGVGSRTNVAEITAPATSAAGMRRLLNSPEASLLCDAHHGSSAAFPRLAPPRRARTRTLSRAGLADGSGTPAAGAFDARRSTTASMAVSAMSSARPPTTRILIKKGI
eukprot:scaffold3497_cov153-Isochrysis_galbana.AAC.3